MLAEEKSYGSDINQQQKPEIVEKNAQSETMAPSLSNDVFPKPATDELNWSTTAFELDLQALARQIVLNCVVLEYTGSTLKLGYHSDWEVMLKPDVQQQIKQAIEQQLGVSLTLDFERSERLEIETPHQADLRKQEFERQTAIQQIHLDPVVQQIKTTFGAELIESSVKKRDDAQ